MKKVSRYAFITGAVLILIALIWSGFSWHRIHDDIQRISHQDFTSKQAAFDSDSVQNINVNISDVAVSIKTRTDASHVRVAYFADKADAFKVTDSNSTVSISRIKTGTGENYFCIFRCLSGPGTITIYVPANSAYRYDLTASNASVSFDNAGPLQTQAIHVSSSNSTITLQQITANGTISLDSDNGSIHLQDVTAGGKLSLDSSNASNVLSNVKAPSITSKTTNGSATLDTVAATDVTVNTSNATIALDRLEADRISLSSNNGGVTGTIVGSKTDYDTRISSDNGGVQVNGIRYNGAYFSDGGNPAKSLTIKSSNAPVHIKFAQ
ncbi:MAG TPA: DUF4097 family beta strand repeat-containing protein [Candidatus Saccharimonadales bacterium]|jgi:DUF4097 and DUF4098 domain-containing protein YvlB